MSKPLTPSIPPSAVAVFGVALLADGSLAKITEGEIDIGRVEEIAHHLALIASDLRIAARAKFLAANE